MNTNLLTIVKQIIAANGEGILENPQRLKAFFGDLAKDEPKPLRIAFGSCLENGAYNALKTAPDTAERASRKAAIAQRLRDDLGLDPALCAEALDILEAAIWVTAPSSPSRCKTCGKELQPEWKACTHCGAGTAEAAPKPAASANPPPITPAVQDAIPAAMSTKKKAIFRNMLIAAGVAVIAMAAALMVNRQKGASIPEDFVFINGGTFMMGSPASEPESDDEVQHRVTVSSFYMGKYEVTQKEYQEVMGTNPSDFEGENLPVEQVSWYDAIEYCNKRSEREGLQPAYTIDKTRFDPNNHSDTEWDTIRWTVTWNKNANGYRLPTEAEWEYACRAGTTTPFNTGNNITTSQANYDGNYPYNNNAKGAYREETTAVGSFAPNRWGLYDMHGNVWEWCWDWYDDYSSDAQTDPVGTVSGSSRVGRGGSWYGGGQSLRSAYRNDGTPSGRDVYVGFRLVRPEFRN